MKNRLWIKILFPVLIVTAIAATLFIGCSSKDASTPANTESTGAALADVDFDLVETTQIDFQAMAEYGLPIIVTYGADKNIHSQDMAPILEKLNAEMQGKAFIKYMDAWYYYDEASSVPIREFYTQVLINADGTPYIPSADVASQIDGFTIYPGEPTGEHIFTFHEGSLTEELMRLILADMGVE